MKAGGIFLAILALGVGFWIIPTLKLYVTDPMVSLITTAFPALDDLNTFLLTLIPFFLIGLVIFIAINLGKGKGESNG